MASLESQSARCCGPAPRAPEGACGGVVVPVRGFAEKSAPTGYGFRLPKRLNYHCGRFTLGLRARGFAPDNCRQACVRHTERAPRSAGRAACALPGRSHSRRPLARRRPRRRRGGGGRGDGAVRTSVGLSVKRAAWPSGLVCLCERPQGTRAASGETAANCLAARDCSTASSAGERWPVLQQSGKVKRTSALHQPLPIFFIRNILPE